MKRKLTRIILFFIMVINIFGRDIYVVYDDSKSMKKDERDIYANYALQTLISLLNPEDTLILTKMSDVNEEFKSKTVLDLKNIPKELENIQKKLIAKSNVTPYKAVTSALYDMEKRENEKKADEKVKSSNWLIVISDGEFEDGNPIPDVEGFQSELGRLIEKTKVKPIFLFIGSKQEELERYELQEGVQLWKNIYGEGGFPKIFKATKQKEIIEKMEEIAELLTEKSSESIEKIYEVSENKLSFNTLFPIKKVILMEQQDELGKINEIKDLYINGKKVEINALYNPKIVSRDKKNIRANILHIVNANDGEDKLESMEIIFKNNIDKKMKLLPEVDADFELSILDENGKEIDERIFEKPSQKVLTLVGKLKQKGEILKNIPGTRIVVEYGDQEIELKYEPETGNYLANLEISEGKKNIDASAKFPGYFNFQSDIYLVEGTEPEIVEIEEETEVIEEIVVEPPKPRLYELDIIPGNSSEKSIYYTQEELKNSKLIFVPIMNNQALSESEFKKTKLDLQTTLSGKLIPGKVKYKDKEVSGWIFTPYHYEGYSNYKNSQGSYNLKATLDLSQIKEELKESNTEYLENQEFPNKNLKIEIEKLSFWGKFGKWIGTIFSILGALIIGYGYMIKERFSSKAKISVQESTEDYSYPEKNIPLKASWINRITPYIPEKKEVVGIDFIAKGKLVNITGEQAVRSFDKFDVKKIIINGEIIEKSELKKRKSYKLFNEGKIEIFYDNGTQKKYTYYSNKKK